MTNRQEELEYAILKYFYNKMVEGNCNHFTLTIYINENTTNEFNEVEGFELTQKELLAIANKAFSDDLLLNIHQYPELIRFKITPKGIKFYKRMRDNKIFWEAPIIEKVSLIFIAILAKLAIIG